MAAELRNRSQFGTFLNDLGLTGTGVEVGAYRGDFAREVLAHWRGKSWYLLDPWEAAPAFLNAHGAVEWDMEAAYAAARCVASEDRRVQVVRVGDESAEDAIPGQIDVAYIDACHDTRSVLQDLHTWWPRVRPGGLLAGHDYLDKWHWSDDINKGVLFGVKTAVDSFAQMVGRRVAATAEEFPTWWLRKPIGSPESVCVVSASTADLPWRALTIRNHERYCRHRGYTYQHHSLSLNSLPASWQKVALVRDAVRQFDWVMWIDADALFQRPDIRLEDFWDGASSLLWMKDDMNGLNCGVFFARRCPDTNDFLDSWHRMSGTSRWRNDKWQENGAAMHLESNGRLPGLIMPHRLANSYPHLPGEWEPTDFVVHCSGLLPNVRLALLQDFDFRAELAFRVESTRKYRIP